MIHRHLDNGDHWGVSYTGYIEEMPMEFEPKVLVQLQEKGEQVRVGMSPEQAEYMAEELLKFAAKVKEGIANRAKINAQ